MLGWGANRRNVARGATVLSVFIALDISNIVRQKKTTVTYENLPRSSHVEDSEYNASLNNRIKTVVPARH